MKAHHVLVAGSSGGGKTTYLREMHDRYEGKSIFLTSKTNERKAVGDPPRRIRRSSCTYPDDVATAREWALAQDGGVQIIVDEAHGALPDSEGASGPRAGNPLRDGLHEDRDQGIKWVVASQDPQDLYYPPLKQCEYFVWVGPVKTFHKGFVEYYNLTGLDMPTSRYEYAVIEPTLPPKIVHRGQTKARYG